MGSTENKTAENLFRESFERLKKNKPIILTKGSSVSQNNVAREAGRDPSALKKDRYPLLVLEIQEYISAIELQNNDQVKKNDNRTRTLKKKLSDCQLQRDKLSSIVLAQNALIEELQQKISQLEENKVLNL